MKKAVKTGLIILIVIVAADICALTTVKMINAWVGVYKPDVSTIVAEPIPGPNEVVEREDVLSPDIQLTVGAEMTDLTYDIAPALEDFAIDFEGLISSDDLVFTNYDSEVKFSLIDGVLVIKCESIEDAFKIIYAVTMDWFGTTEDIISSVSIREHSLD